METMININPPRLEHFCDLNILLGPSIEMGNGSAGIRRIIPIIGGTVSGPDIHGEVLNLGADWQTVFSSNTAHLDTRYAMKTDDGAVIEIVNRGLRHGPPEVLKAIANGETVAADQYYMRTHAVLETGAERYKWINDCLFVGTGARHQSAVEMRLFAIR